jgi:hypothetical protein
MFRLLIAASMLVGFIFLRSSAQEPDREPNKQDLSKPAAKIVETPAPGDVEVHFLNGSTVRMLVQSEKLEIATPYGKLAVPIQDVRAIEFGLHFPEAVADKIQAAVRRLGSSDFRERANAAKALVELGPYSYPAVLEASRLKDLETARRGKEVVKQLQAKHPRKDLKVLAEDKVVTPTFTVVGRILTPTIKARTELFGQVELSLSKMRTLRAIAIPSADVEVKVDAAKYANAGQWLATDYQVDGHTALVITAKGVVDTWPQQPGQYLVGPNGVQGMGGGMIIGGVGGVRRIVGGAVAGPAAGGMLMGKIGEDGEPFAIGERYDGMPEKEGTLYLHIGPSPWQCQSTGSYEVKISRKE